MDSMYLTDTPCPPANRRKRLRPVSPNPDSTLPLPDPDNLTADLPTRKLIRRPLNSLSILPKRRKIPLNLTQKTATTAAITTQQVSKPLPPSIADKNKKDRRMSTRSQTARTAIPLLSSPTIQIANSSVLHADVSSIDSTSTTIMPHSSPNSSSLSFSSNISKSEPPQNPPPKKRRRISELVRRVAAAAVSKATNASIPPPPAQKSKPLTTKPKPIKKDVSKPVEKKKPSAKPTKALPSSTLNKKSRVSNASTAALAIQNQRPALKAVHRGMNPAPRSTTTSIEAKKPSTTAANCLRLSKQAPTKSFSDTEFAKHRVSKPAQSKRPTRKSASSAYPPLHSTLPSAYALKPELYDTSWVENQELLLTQILNDILSSKESSGKSEDETRRSLLHMYNTPEYCNLLDRLKASILHGVLKPSEDQLDREIKLAEDLGLRDKFAKIFLKSYTPRFLKVAMEVITGRSLYSPSTATAAPTETELQKFFETFFIDIADEKDTDSKWESYGANAHGTLRTWIESDSDSAGPSSKAWALRRTILRTLLLTNLLDRAKTSGMFGFGNQNLLFRKDSENKSSDAVLTAACKILLPALGGPARAVRNCRYTVEYAQSREEEYCFEIRNLKVDLRDGVRLARAVEVLSSSRLLSSAESMTKVAMIGDTNGIGKTVSLHPKSKAEKVTNVDKVLEYLYTTNALPEGTVRAVDIVDGHREVTLSVLWAFVAGVGVDRLVDWRALEAETRRVCMKYKIGLDREDGKGGLKRLERWIGAVSMGRGIGDTSGEREVMREEAVMAVIEEYEPLADVPIKIPSENGKERMLKDRLKGIGCSESFLKLFTPGKGRIVNETYVLAALAFLASRVLASTKKTRAAMMLQSWWRRVDFRRSVSDRIRLAVENAREVERAMQERREERAARIIQRAWRGAVERRVKEITSRIVGAQAFARGYLIRRKMDYSFKSRRAIAAKKEVVLKKEEADPYKLKGKVEGEEGGGKVGGKKAKRRKGKVVEDVDIWQDLAEIAEI
ncbi:hypothetical protein ABW20_dc0100651 [Dactylellina cionopaga]|nr:hypothetical protein ABW20_dc0100651 [Dactylellina cionopaga]